jgi:hypothetical protein
MTEDIDALLKQHFRQQEYIDDEGFTANVMMALPQQKKLSPWLKFCIYWLPVLLVSLWVIGQLPLRDIIHQVTAFWLLADAKEFMLIAGAAFALLMTYVGFNFMADEEA